MEIDITHMVKDSDEMIELSGNRMEHGDNAGQITWDNSKAYAAKYPLLTPEQFDDARDYFVSTGGWTREEVAAWSEEELQAITVQEIASQIREMEHYKTIEEYHERGGGSLYQGDNGQWYAYIGF